VLGFIYCVLLVKLKQLFLKKSELSFKLEKESTEEETKSAVYGAGIGLVLKCSKAGPAQWITLVA
jgi:hypothetical protein